jgi:hypothetical protein
MPCLCPLKNSCDKRSHIAYLTIDQLKQACSELELPTSGLKSTLIERVSSKITGKKERDDKDKRSYPSFNHLPHDKIIKPQSYILPQNYKSNLITRNFFKKFIGNHFAFTASGQRWIRAQWRQGIAPTYKEFAEFWIKEHKERKSKQTVILEQFAYNRFTREFLLQNPQASPSLVRSLWKKKQKEETDYVFQLIRLIKPSS